MDDLIPGDVLGPGAGAAGGADYVLALLGAFDVDPPRIWAGGPTSGRHGGPARFAAFLELGPWEQLAWRERIAELASIYDAGLDALGDDYPGLGLQERAGRRAACAPEFLDAVFTHACESLYGDPVYGGNVDRSGWRSIGHRGDVQPAGYSDDEVSAP